jgi:hypothetical protein
MQTIREILGLNFLSLSFDDDDRKKYNANAEGKRIEEVIIDGVKITGYNAFSFVRKLTYVKSPTRSADGTIGNLDSYPVFTTPQLQIDFSLLGIDMYRKIMNLIYARREHVVQCYDIVRDTQVTEKMYFEPEELPKLATITRQLQSEEFSRIEILGVQDYVVTMVGTNVPNELININYYDRNNKIIPNASEQMVENTEILIGEGVSVEEVSGYKFDNKWQRGYVDENGDWVGIGEPYIGKQAYRVVLESAEEIANKRISFKAVYKSNQEFNLVLNYGLGEEIKENDVAISTFSFTPNNTYLNVIRIDGVSGLPTTYPPQMEFNGVKYTTYKRLGWFLTPTYAPNSTALTNSTVINISSDFAIYQLFEPILFELTLTSIFISDNIATHSTTNTLKRSVGSNILSEEYKDVELDGNKYNLVGIYEDIDFEKQFNESMPPYNIKLYAKLEKVK